METFKGRADSGAGTPRVKYHVEQLGRSFERLLKENSLEELRNVIRKKLSVDGTTRLNVVQAREGRLYDLEDDDDFEAFKAAAVEYSSLDVQVSFPEPGQNVLEGDRPDERKNHAVDSDDVADGHKAKTKGGKRSAVLSVDESGRKSETKRKSIDKKDSRSVPPEPDEPPKKKRKRSGGGETILSPGMDTAPTVLPENIPKDTEEAPRKKGKMSSEGEIVNVPSPEIDTAPTFVPKRISIGIEEAPKKKRKKSSNLDLEGDTHSFLAEPGSVTGNLKLRAKKGDKVTERNSEISRDIRKGQSKSKDVHFSIPETVHKDSAPASAPTASASNQSDVLSKIKQAILEFQKAPPPTPEEISVAYVTRKSKPPPIKKKRAKALAAGNSSLNEGSVLRENDGQTALQTNTSLSEPTDKQATGPSAASIPVPSSPIAHAKSKSSSKQTTSPHCPVCFEQPFHLRSLCPVIKLGGSDLQRRITELEEEGGPEDLLEELREWLAKGGGKPASDNQMEVDNESVVGETDQVPALKPSMDESHDCQVESPTWTSIGPRDGHVSEVTVESRGEGSENEETSTSDSGSDTQEEPEDLKDKSPSRVRSSPESSESDHPSSGSILRSKTLFELGKPPENVDLENVDLDALVKGPPIKVELAKLAAEEESDTTEEKASLLEDTDSEKRPRRAKGWKPQKSRSPEDVDHMDDESETPSYGKSDVQHTAYEFDPLARNDAESSTSNSRGDADAVAENVADVLKLPGGSEPDTSSDPEKRSGDAEFPLPAGSKTSSGRPFEASLTKSPTALPNLQSPRSPIRVVQEIKDRTGHGDEIGVGDLFLPSSDDSSTPTPSPEDIEKPLQGPIRVSPRRMRSHARAEEPSGAELTGTSAATKLKLSKLPKRRGRPPVSDAVKAERKAIKDAAMAEKRAQAEERRQSRKSAKNRTPRKKGNEREVAHPASATKLAPPFMPAPTSRRKGSEMNNGSSVASPPSAEIDQLKSSSPAVQLNKDNVSSNGIASSTIVDGIKSPRTASASTSGSKRLDEEDVEQIIGSMKANNNNNNKPNLVGEPLFLPGASPPTQPPASPRFPNHGRGFLDQSDSVSQANVENETDKGEKSSQEKIGSQSSKSMFPSLSQLSFDKFRPNFFLQERSRPQLNEKPEVRQEHEEESDSDDDSSEEEKISHIPKGRLAGTGVVRKRKRSGLLGD